MQEDPTALNHTTVPGHHTVERFRDETRVHFILVEREIMSKWHGTLVLDSSIPKTLSKLQREARKAGKGPYELTVFFRVAHCEEYEPTTRTLL